MHLIGDIYLVGSGRTGFGISDPYDCHVYLLDGGGELALIDAGAGVNTGPILRNIQADGFALENVSQLILTHSHSDHTGGAAEIRRLAGCRVLCGAADAQVVASGDAEASGLNVAVPFGIYPPGYAMRPCAVDAALSEGDQISVGRYSLTVLHTPGHSPGAICLQFGMGGRQVLISGDTIQFCPVQGQVGWISLLNAPGTDLAAYRTSARRLAGLGIEVLLPGHRLVALSDGQRVINSVAEGFEKLSVPRSVI